MVYMNETQTPAHNLTIGMPIRINNGDADFITGIQTAHDGSLHFTTRFGNSFSRRRYELVQIARMNSKGTW